MMSTVVKTMFGIFVVMITLRPTSSVPVRREAEKIFRDGLCDRSGTFGKIMQGVAGCPLSNQGSAVTADNLEMVDYLALQCHPINTAVACEWAYGDKNIAELSVPLDGHTFQRTGNDLIVTLGRNTKKTLEGKTLTCTCLSQKRSVTLPSQPTPPPSPPPPATTMLKTPQCNGPTSSHGNNNNNNNNNNNSPTNWDVEVGCPLGVRPENLERLSLTCQRQESSSAAVECHWWYNQQADLGPVESGGGFHPEVHNEITFVNRNGQLDVVFEDRRADEGRTSISCVCSGEGRSDEVLETRFGSPSL